MESGSPAEAEAPPAVQVEGYRSARFGMTEEEVREAISRDFNLGSVSVQSETHPTQKTRVLSVWADDLLPDAGLGKIYYVLGYRSKKLMQVNIIWGHPANPNPDAERLVLSANLLRDYFLRQGYQKEGLAINRPLAKGVILVFEGKDLKGSSTELFLIQKSKEGSSEQQPTTLRLSYKEKPHLPDIYQIKRGIFKYTPYPVSLSLKRIIPLFFYKKTFP